MLVAMATVVATGSGAFGGLAAAQPPAPPPDPNQPGSALTADHKPETYEPGDADTTPNVGGAPSPEPWTPAVVSADPGQGVVSGQSTDPGGAISPQMQTQKVGPGPNAGAAGIGLRDFSPVEVRQISDKLQLLTNLANGNIVVRYTNSVVAAEGQASDVSHVYNNMSTGSGAFGRGWAMSTGLDVGLEIINSGATVKLHGPTGYVVTYTRQSNGSYTGSSGANSKLTRASDGVWTIKWDKTEDRWLFHPNGVMKEQLTKNNVSTKLNYDAANNDRVAAIYDSIGRVTKFEDYDSEDRVLSYTDPVGREHGPFNYDAAGDLVSFEDQLDNEVKFGYSNGNLTSITSPNGDVYTIGYDAQRRVTSINEPNGQTPATTQYSYPASGRTTETDPRGGVSNYYFDSQGRQTKAVDQLGNEQSKTWTANSDVASTTDALGSNLTYAFDANNRPTSATLPTGASNSVGYSNAAHPYFPTSMTDAQGNQMTRLYNAAGDLTSVRSVQQNRDVVKFEYNAAGQPTKKTDGANRVTTYQYGGGGRMTVETPPTPMQPRVIGYDNLDRVTQIVDGNGSKIFYRYDAMDRLVEIGRDNNGTYVPLQYNNFDAEGNMVGRYFGDTGLQLAYSPRNQVTEAHNTRSGVIYRVFYRYDASNNVTDLFNDGGHTFYDYDAANRLTFQRGPKTGMEASHQYDKNDQRTKTTYPGNFTVSTTYDKSGRQTALVAATSGGTKRIDRTYRWTNANNQDTTQLQRETREGTAFSYTYDTLNQLTARNSSAGNLTYALDGASNLTSAEGRNFGINSAGQVASGNNTTYTHDGAGNLTTGSNGLINNTYSPTNQLRSSTTAGNGTIDFTYDSVDQAQRAVISKNAGGVVTEQRLENTAIGVTAITTNGARSEFTRDPAGRLIGQTAPNGQNLYAVTDYQGSTLALIDGNGALAAKYDYKPYGDTTSTGTAAAGNPFRWIGAQQLADNHGTYLTGYRQHNPILARFTQPDPSQAEPNPYTYGLANPCSYSDPSGLDALGCAKAVGAGVGLVAGVAGAIYFFPVTAVAGASLAVTQAVAGYTLFGAVAGGVLNVGLDLARECGGY